MINPDRTNTSTLRGEAGDAKAGLTQGQLAKRVGTTGSVISRLGSADYRGHSLSMLQRISHAMNYGLEVHFVPRRTAKKIPA